MKLHQAIFHLSSTFRICHCCYKAKRNIGCCILVALSSSTAFSEDTGTTLATAAFKRTEHSITYDGRHFSIPYPDGDIPQHLGVCTDVVIRSYRALGIDLQQLVYEDMRANFEKYPAQRIWGQTRPDTNIDHRRVPNLEVFFARHGKNIAVTTNMTDYLPGDIVSWRLNGNLPHIGIVSDRVSTDGTPLIIHNIGQGPKLEDILFSYPLTGHYRYHPAG